MAQAEMKTETTTVVTGVTLELSGEEATMLIDVLARIGGCPDTSRRRYVSSVYDALDEAGVKRKNSYRNSGDLPGNGMYFEDEVGA